MFTSHETSTGPEDGVPTYFVVAERERHFTLLDKVAAHLGLRSPLPRQAALIYAQPSLRIKNTSTKAHATIPMANATLRLLEGFYQPYNAALAEELKDDRWLWADAKPVCDPCM